MKLTDNQKGNIKFLAIFFIILVVVIGIFLIKNPSPEKQLTGQWQLAENEENDYVRMINDDFPVDNVYFYEDGQMSMNGMNCTYSINGNEMTISSFFGGTNYYEYILTNNSLTLKRTNGPYAGTSANYVKVE